ncbi:DUF485 domain-containing protein [Streptomyces purpurogeneiscleroticus]|uniref:DUF485 domain-containing protein n=1 Tax=Streptomyces purpurogeneiscleroticus TaxID=68259 RepID=UPI001CBCB5AE|nr:DUF485 domain-containing protein [Streptomyces purpurogeneiscleroticus]MBZ4017545.1 hypothetical protein [Streptomyces purpurogeneiscleroticus]
MEKRDGRPAGAVRLDDPWYDTPASGQGDQGAAGREDGGVPAQRADADDEERGTAEAAAEDGPDLSWPSLPAQRADAPGEPTHAEVYLTVQRSAAFQEVRRRYRSFVMPATALFLTWYLAYVIAAVTAPGLMARQVMGPLNVAMLAGLGQFVTTFVLTWAYARHARLRRDRAALDLRWETQEMTGGNLR